MIKTRDQLLDEIERETLSKVRDLLRRGSALFEGTPDFSPPKEPSEDAETGDDGEIAAWKAYASELEEYAAKLHYALEELHESLVDYESEAAQALVDFDSLTRQYDIAPLPPKARE
jgi:hypothetical protein